MGLFDSIGSGLNSLLGGTSSAKTSHRNQLKIMEKQHEYNQIYAKNAHQWEVQDLKNAGLNPAIAAGGSTGGAIAGSSVGASPGAGSTNGNVLDLIGIGNSIADTISKLKTNEVNNAKTEAETDAIVSTLPYISEEKKEKLNNLKIDNELKKEQTEQIRTGKLGHIMGTDNAKLINDIVYEIAGLKGKSAKKLANNIKSVLFKGGEKGKAVLNDLLNSGLFDLGTWGK